MTGTMNNPHSAPRVGTHASRSGFSLVELLTVIFIIALVLAIVLPALGSARDAARKAATSQQLTDLMNATSAFQQDQRRVPGYFSPRDMGGQQNLTEGFTSMENMMLDLLGPSAVAKSRGSWSTSEAVEVGPISGAGNKVWVNTSLLSTDKKAYYSPPAKQFVAQYNDGGANIKQFGAAGNTGQEGDVQMPDLVDAFGSPILAWVQDDSASLRPVDEIDGFAQEFDKTAQPGSNSAARFWWAQNAGFLKATATGKNSVNQKTGSLLGEDVTANDRSKTLMGLLGSPNTPVQATAALATDQLLAGGPKGRVMIHSAGKDGVFLSKEGKQSTRGQMAAGGPLVYGLGLKDAAGKANVDSEGKPTIVDILGGFDDLFVAGGN